MNNRNRKVYVLSYGACCALGKTVHQCADALETEQTALIAKDGSFQGLLDGISSTDTLSRLEKMMIHSIDEAIGDCKSLLDDNTLLVFSSTKGNIGNIESPQTALDCFESLAANVKSHYGLHCPHVMISNACISGVLALVYAAKQLKSGRYTNAVIVGGDELSEFVRTGFESFHSVSPNPCRPYDKDRDGISLGEASAAMILTTDEAFSSNSHYVITGGSSSNDANHISGPSRTGEELALAISRALDEANISASAVDMVCMHGTATVYNDEMESKAVGLLDLNSKPIVSMKGYFGHTLGASGLLEIVLSLEMMNRGEITRTIGFAEQGTPVQLNVTASTLHSHVDTMLKTASGFGGCNAALVIQRKDKAASVGTAKHYDIAVRRELHIEKGNDNLTVAEFLKGEYKQLGLSYPKFYKMDGYTKLGFLAVERLLDGDLLAGLDLTKVGIVINTRSGCLDSDLDHLANIKDEEKGASPATFVYTLPNVVAGEIAIRHHLKGINYTFISLDSAELETQLSHILNSECMDALVCLDLDCDRVSGRCHVDTKLIVKA